MKTFILLVLLAVLGIFIYLKVEVQGDPNSSFNQTTRYSLGAHPVLRAVLGLHNPGDARAEYLAGSGPIAIVWLAPEDDNIDSSVLQNFAAEVSKYSGRQADVVSGGYLDDGTMQLSNLKSFTVKAANQAPDGSAWLNIFFTDDYSPRPNGELSTTYQESGIVLSLAAHNSFLQGSSGQLDNYLLTSMLREFGYQIGLPVSTDPNCIMGSAAGIDGQPMEFFNGTTPQDFCPAEQQEINSIKLQLQNN